MPESRHKYLYERLGDHDFQQLVNALLTARFTDYMPLPLRQAEGGRDGVRRAAKETLVYQVKWSGAGSERNPVGWLDAAVRAEEQNIRRLVREGVRKYLLVTNVPSTGKPGRGTFDKLDAKLIEHAKSFGLEQMSCLWREAVDSMVDSASTETKWAYADMLAGWDLIRYLISEHTKSRRDSGLRSLVRKVAVSQWEDDERVKFSQVDIDRERVADLFVDVTAERLHLPERGETAGGTSGTPDGGVASYLLSSKFPFVVIRGAPGQGKSTLSQYVCQVHRAAFVPKTVLSTPLPDVNEPRFPLRFDLGDYAAWLQGADVFDPSEDKAPKRRGKKSASESTLECFLAELMTHAAGSGVLDANDVQSLFERVPVFVVLDGLDEVGSPATRNRVVSEIDRFCRRARSYTVPPKIIVTTRPNAGDLPEPSRELFEILSLNTLDQTLRDEYLRKWCAVHGIRGRDGRTLRSNFREKSREPYISELAGNPMQLTILLDLLHQQGEATPTQRTELYDSYMGLLLAREANKHPDSVRKHRKDLMEIIPFLGWYVQSRSEERDLRGRMSVADLDAAMKHFQRTYGKPESVVDELFEAATDRLWALTSKEDGTYEFEVVSLREYFAARFLYSYAGEGDRTFDRVTVFRELLRRSYWLNTARFYGGNAVGSDVYALAAGIRDELDTSTARQALVASWTLLTDGVFLSRPQEAENVLETLCSNTREPLLLDALDRKQIRPLPQPPRIGGSNRTWDRLTKVIAAKPSDRNNPVHVRTLRELLGQRGEFASWWSEQIRNAVGTADERPWLAIAAGCEAAAGVELDLAGVNLTGDGAQLVLNTGLVPPTGGALEIGLVRAILDGQCPDTTSIRSLPAQIAASLAPSGFYTTSDSGFTGESERVAQRRTDAIRYLRRANSPYAPIAALRRFKPGEKGSTFPWANTATALFERVGRCWLASEIAVIGAASRHLDGFPRKPGTAAFGPSGHPATLMAAARANANNQSWWTQQLIDAADPLAKAECALALWAVANGPVIDSLMDEWEHTVGMLPEREQRAFLAAATRLGYLGLLRDRPVTAKPMTRAGERLIECRAVMMSTPKESASMRIEPEPRESLASVARNAKWLKVDAPALYH